MKKEMQFILYSLPDEEGKAQVVIKDEYDIFNKIQRIDSDFDKQVREMLEDKE